jgi:hypothetical protein
MNPRAFIRATIINILWVLMIFIFIFLASLLTKEVRAELPPGMHLANLVRVDTAYYPHRTLVSAWLDSVWRADSLKERGKK